MMPRAAHLLPTSTVRRLFCQTVLLLMVVSSAALTGACSEPPSQAPLPDLHIPGVTKIPGIERLEQQNGAHVIAGMTTYVSASDHQPHVLFGNGSGVYDVRLDGSDLQRTPIACGELNSVSPDQHWLACKDNAGVSLVDLQIQMSSRSDHPIVGNGDGYYVGDPSWAPDNRHLAITAPMHGECAIAIYRASADYSTFTMTMLLPLPDFTVMQPGGVGCDAHGLAWSPDGAWLVLRDYGSANQMYGLPLARLPGRGLANPSPAMTISIARQQLVPFPHTIGASFAVWSSIPNVLTYVDQQGRSIQEVNVVTGQQMTLLGQQAAGVLALSWTPDGEHLVFAYGFPFDVNPPPPQQLYVYSPPSGHAGP